MEVDDNTRVGCGCIVIVISILMITLIDVFRSNDDNNGIDGPKVMIIQKDCIGCVDIDAFNQCVRYSSNNDSEGIMNMLLSEKAYMVQAGQECIVVDENYARTKIRVTVPGGKRVVVYVPSSILK